MAEGRHKGSDPTILIVLLICVIVGMIQGARGLVHSSGDGFNGFRRAKAVAVENVDNFRGTLRVSTSACQDTPALDEVRYQVTDKKGTEVANLTRPLVSGRERQSADVGKNLGSGRYKVSVSCICDGKPTGDQKSTRVTVQNDGQETASVKRPNRLPHTGR
ncbi:hypothetical protein AAEX63_06530 [Luteococcus sp. H138]|uniref:hypothetical protein n=1 Tax=unclassified Luteococcus TaxID=2639923 RepID=UPI00313CA4CF